MTELEDRVDREVGESDLNTPELVIFDCDGVLVDSEILSCRLESELLHQIGVPLTPEEVMSQFVGLSYESMIREISTGHGVELPSDFKEISVERFLNAIETELEVVPGIDEVIGTLPFPCCVASSSPIDRIERSLAVTGLLERFEGRIYSAQMVSLGKPAPDLFLLAANESRVSPERCLVIEDSPYGVAAGVSAGMDVIGFTAGSHCRGDLARELVRAGAATIATSSVELQSILAALAGTTSPTPINPATPDAPIPG